MPRQQTLAVTLGLVLVQVICVALYVLEAIARVQENGRRIANLAMIALGELMQLVFLVLIVRFCGRQCHRRAIDWISKRVGQRTVLATLFVEMVFMITACSCIFYNYFSHNENYEDKWIYETNLWISFTSIIYLGEVLKTIRQQTRIVNYSVYLMILLLGILYCAQVPIFTKKLAFGTEIYLQIVLILFSMKVFWEKTPLLLQLVILAVEIVCMQTTISFLISSDPPPSTFIIVLQAIKCLFLLTHSVHCFTSTMQRLYKFFKTLSQVKDDTPMKLSAILSLQKTTIPISQHSELEINIPQCSICMLQLKVGSQMYLIPCSHHFHCECLKNWLLVKNWCPNCHVRVE